MTCGQINPIHDPDGFDGSVSAQDCECDGYPVPEIFSAASPLDLLSRPTPFAVGPFDNGHGSPVNPPKPDPTGPTFLSGPKLPSDGGPENPPKPVDDGSIHENPTPINPHGGIA